MSVFVALIALREHPFGALVPCAQPILKYSSQPQSSAHQSTRTARYVPPSKDLEVGGDSDSRAPSIKVFAPYSVILPLSFFSALTIHIRTAWTIYSLTLFLSLLRTSLFYELLSMGRSIGCFSQPKAQYTGEIRVHNP